MGIFDIIKNAVNTVVDPLLFGDAIVFRKAKTSNGRGGSTYVATQHACRALVIEYTDFQRSTDGIPAQNRQLLLAIDSLSIEFKSDDVIGFPDGSFWRPAVAVGEPSFSILTVQVSTAPAPMVGAVGTGLFNVGNFTFSATGVATNVGIGEWNVEEFTFAGEGEATGTETLEGVGDYTFDFSFEATGLATLPGEGSFTVDEFAFLGEGRQDASGTGDWTYDFTFLGSGYGSNIGSGAITLDEFTFSGAGVGTFTATADFTISEFVFAGEGTVEEAVELWTPENLSTPPAFWLDASVTSSITKDGSNRVSAWADRSGNNNDATASATHYPLYNASNSSFNDMPTIGPDAAGQGMIMDTNVFSIDYVAMSGNDMLIGSYSSDTNFSLPANVILYAVWDNPANIGATRINGGAANIGGETSATGSAALFSAARLAGTYGGVDPDNIYGRVFDKTQGSIMDRTSDYARGINAQFGEILYLTTPPETDERQLIEGYLAHKWGLEGNLASDHPYKDGPPNLGISATANITIGDFTFEGDAVAGV